MRSVTLLCVLLAACSVTLAQEPGAKPPAAPPRDTVADVQGIESYTAGLSQARRKMFVDAMSGLDASQLETFWSVYADFEKDRNALAADRAAVINAFIESFGAGEGLTDADITHAVRDIASINKRSIDLRLKYFEIYARRIDVKTAGRFALLDDYVSSEIRYELLGRIPFPGDEGR